MKRLRTLILILACILLMVVTASALGSDVKVKVNNELIDFPDAKPFIDDNSRTLVPVRFIAEELGAAVEWDSTVRKVSIKKGEKEFILEIDKSSVACIVNEVTSYITIDTKAIIKDGRTFVPLRFIGESFNAHVLWDAGTKTVLIDDTDKLNEPKGVIESIADSEIRGDLLGLYAYFTDTGINNTGNDYSSPKLTSNFLRLKDEYPGLQIKYGQKIDEDKAYVRWQYFYEKDGELRGLYGDEERKNGAFLKKVDGKWRVEDVQAGYADNVDIIKTYTKYLEPQDLIRRVIELEEQERWEEAYYNYFTDDAKKRFGRTGTIKDYEGFPTVSWGYKGKREYLKTYGVTKFETKCNYKVLNNNRIIISWSYFYVNPKTSNWANPAVNNGASLKKLNGIWCIDEIGSYYVNEVDYFDYDTGI